MQQVKTVSNNFPFIINLNHSLAVTINVYNYVKRSIIWDTIAYHSIHDFLSALLEDTLSETRPWNAQPQVEGSWFQRVKERVHMHTAYFLT